MNETKLKKIQMLLHEAWALSYQLESDADTEEKSVQFGTITSTIGKAEGLLIKVKGVNNENI